MPEWRDVQADAAIAAFIRAGGVRRSGKGDHVNIKMPNGQIITFSGVRGPVKVGLPKALIRGAGLSDDEFLRLIGRKR